MAYIHLTTEERYQIFGLQMAGLNPPAIARQLGRHRSTINREIKRNLVIDPRVPGYSPSRADELARSRVICRSHLKRISAETWQCVHERLQERLSPEQISGRRARLGLPAVSHESIYRHIWADRRQGGTLWIYLRGRLRRGRHYRKNHQRGQIVGRVGIEHRAMIANQRGRCGDYEVDTVFGQRHRAPLLTIVDRRSRYLLVEPLPSKHASPLGEALVQALRQSARPVHTITSDNGKEFAAHRQIAQALKAKFYFARPYASWERGTNENTNGLLRQYFPKDRDFSTITQQEIDFAVNQMNHRPRKILGYRTPHEVFFNRRRVAL
jgi:transposase, IS30 family